MKKHLLFSSAILMIASACSSDEPMVSYEPKENVPTAYNVSPDDALKIAEYYISTLQDSPTRASTREVGSINIITGGIQTRSSDTDTLLYVINYKDDQGFAIIGADKRAMPIYAMSDTGSFEISEDSPESLKIFFSNAQKDVAEKINDNGNGNGNGSFTIPEFGGIDLFPPPSLYDEVAPLISKYQSNIGPSDELCKYVTNDKGEPAKTCCVPIAAEIFMSYHKWPESLEGYTFNWESMNAGTDNDGIARLLAIISSRNYFHVMDNDSQNIGKVYLGSIIPAFKKCKYTFPSQTFSPTYFTEDRVNAEVLKLLKTNGPLLIDGRSSIEQNNGHMWVIDGMRQCHKQVYDNNIMQMAKFDLYHCIWGVGGVSNGYYLAEGNFFDEKPDSHGDTDTGEDEAGWEWRYFNKVGYLKNLIPLK